MITISTEQGFINIESWDDVIHNSGYRSNLDPSEHKLDSIIGRYIEKEMVQCGLSNCRTNHGKGYLVKTKSGLSTNIGKDCGKKFFGVDFENMAKKFERDLEAQNNRESLASFSMNIDELELSIKDIREGSGGADFLYKKSRALITKSQELPDVIVTKITDMVKLSNYALTKEREATKEETEQAVAINPQTRLPLYINEQIAVIDGLLILEKDYDLRNILIIDIQQNINAFKELNIDAMDYKDLKWWSKWVAELDNKLEKAKLAVEAGRALLLRRNLEPLQEVIDDNRDMSLFKKFLRSLD